MEEEIVEFCPDVNEGDNMGYSERSVRKWMTAYKRIRRVITWRRRLSNVVQMLMKGITWRIYKRSVRKWMEAYR